MIKIQSLGDCTGKLLTAPRIDLIGEGGVGVGGAGEYKCPVLTCGYTTAWGTHSKEAGKEVGN